MATALLPALRRTVLLSVLAFAAASLAFGTVMLTSPPISEAAVSTLTVRAAGLVSIRAFGSTDWIALVTDLAQPPQVMPSILSSMRNLLVLL